MGWMKGSASAKLASNTWRAPRTRPGHLPGLAPQLKRKRFHPVVLPPLDEEMKVALAVRRQAGVTVIRS
jgi:hypothetical protein